MLQCKILSKNLFFTGYSFTKEVKLVSMENFNLAMLFLIQGTFSLEKVNSLKFFYKKKLQRTFSTEKVNTRYVLYRKSQIRRLFR